MQPTGCAGDGRAVGRIMQLLPSRGNSRVWFGRTDRPYAFTSPCPGGEFALLLVVGDDNISPGEQGDLSLEFVRQGCRYAVCRGSDCSSWDDSIDMVCVMDEIEGRSGPFVMTTWHDDEPIEDVVEFFAVNTRFDDWAAQVFVVLIVGGPDDLEAEVRASVEKRFG